MSSSDHASSSAALPSLFLKRSTKPTSSSLVTMVTFVDRRTRRGGRAQQLVRREIASGRHLALTSPASGSGRSCDPDDVFAKA